jgi:hypothetical protein
MQDIQVTLFWSLIWLLSILLTIYITHNNWKELKPQLFPLQSTDSADAMSVGASEPGLAIDAPRLIKLLEQVRSLLDSQGIVDIALGAAALRKLEAGDGPAIVASLIKASMDTAEVHSQLFSFGEVYGYIVVVPNRHEHSHMLRRYESFSAGWRAHLERVRASLMASGEFSALFSILIFLSPERGKESLLLLSYADPGQMLLPAVLLQGEDLKAAGVKTLNVSLEINLSS